MTPERYQRQTVEEMKDHVLRMIAARMQQLAAADASDARLFAWCVPEYARAKACRKQEYAAESYRFARQAAGVES